MGLPAELRDMIYELALADSNGIGLVCKTKSYRRTVARGLVLDDGNQAWYGRRRHHEYRASQSQASQTENKLIPALLAVNKQIYSEAIGYLYQQPIFFADTYALHSFLCLIGNNRSRVTDLTVKGWGSGRGTNHAMNAFVFPLLGLCTKLETLFLDCTIGCMRNPKDLARQVYRDGHHFFEAYGTSNGSKDAAIDVLVMRGPNFHEVEFKTQFQAELRKLLGC